MPRKTVPKSSIYPYHVYNRSIDKHFYPVNPKLLWEKCCDLLRVVTWAYGFKVHAFTLMSNHYHLLVSTPDENLGEGLKYFQSELSIWVREQTKRQRFRFGCRYKASLIQDSYHFMSVYRYVLQNPLRAGLCSSLLEHPYNSFTAKLGLSPDCPPINSPSIAYLEAFNDPWEELEYLDRLTQEEDVQDTRRALRKSVFEYTT